MTTVTISLVPNTESADTTNVLAVPAAGEVARGVVRVPLFIPRSQLYYWTPEWQEGEAEALDDILHGRVRRFSSGAEAAQWLLSNAD